MQIKSSNSWKTGQLYAKVAGTWKDVLVPYVKTGGVWRATWSYSWTIGSWSGCSTTCGTGTQSRSVVCKRNDNITVADKFCTAYGLSKPATSQSCTESSGCVSYSWYTGAYGSCSTTCGSGTKTRTVYCRRNDGTRVSDSYCSGTKPSTSTSCSSTSGCTYSWYSGSYGSCSISLGRSVCGQGYKYRSVYCRRSDGSSMSDSYCSGTKPSTSTSCKVCTGCRIYTEDHPDWSEDVYIKSKIDHMRRTTGRTWGYTEMRNALIKESGSCLNHYMSYSDSERVCGIKACLCCSPGWTYYTTDC